MIFTIALTTVAIMLCYAIPGYLLVKGKLIPPSSISAFATVLLYLNAPFQTIYAMQQIDLSAYILKYLALTLFLALALMGGMMGLIYFITRKQQERVPFRICTTAAVFGNCGFMGIPLLEALMPHYPQAVAYAAAFFLAQTIMMWTVGSFIITRNIKHMNIKKVFVNPGTIAMALSLALLFCRVRFTGQVADLITLLNRMATPMCMLILGMRLGAIPLRPMFTNPLQYLAIGLKLLIFPLLALLVVKILPVEADYRMAIYVMACAPVGNVVLSFAEMLGEGQDVAANVVLLSTFLSVLTIPVMLLLI